MVVVGARSADGAGNADEKILGLQAPLHASVSGSTCVTDGVCKVT